MKQSCLKGKKLVDIGSHALKYDFQGQKRSREVHMSRRGARMSNRIQIQSYISDVARFPHYVVDFFNDVLVGRLTIQVSRGPALLEKFESKEYTMEELEYSEGFIMTVSDSVSNRVCKFKKNKETHGVFLGVELSRELWDTLVSWGFVSERVYVGKETA